VTTGNDYNEDGAFADRPALLSGDLSALYSHGGDPTQVLLPASEARTRLGTPANVTNPFLQIPRNAFRAPNVRYYDVSLAKRFQLSESVRLRFEANILNVTNTPNFRAQASTLNSASFGRNHQDGRHHESTPNPTRGNSAITRELTFVSPPLRKI
jgi:hypothetical protein